MAISRPKPREIPEYKELVCKEAERVFSDLMNGGYGKIDYTVILFCYVIDKKQCEKDIENEVLKLQERFRKHKR